MTRNGLHGFIGKHRLAVLATVAESGIPESAVVGFAASPELELIFDTLNTSRKYRNLLRNGHIAFVIGWDEEITVQYEGIAEEPSGAELERVKEIYFQKWPECRAHQAWPGIAYLKVTPKWVRYSDFNEGSREVVEFDF